MINWNTLDLQALARAWMEEDVDRPEAEEGGAGEQVTLLYFFASPEIKWRFLLAAMEASDTEDQLGMIAAGPLEYLLGRHGEDWIGAVEARSAADPRFARMTCLAWQYLMTDAVWQRLLRIRDSLPDRD